MVKESKPSVVVRLKKFDWVIGSGFVTILGMATLFYLQHHFVPLERYEKDETERMQLAKENREDMKEIQRDIKKLLERK